MLIYTYVLDHFQWLLMWNDVLQLKGLWSLHRSACSPALFWPLPMSLRSFLLPLHSTLCTPTRTTSATMATQRRWRRRSRVDPRRNEKKIMTPGKTEPLCCPSFRSARLRRRLSSATSRASSCGIPFESDVLFPHMIYSWCKNVLVLLTSLVFS